MFSHVVGDLIVQFLLPVEEVLGQDCNWTSGCAPTSSSKPWDTGVSWFRLKIRKHRRETVLQFDTNMDSVILFLASTAILKLRDLTSQWREKPFDTPTGCGLDMQLPSTSESTPAYRKVDHVDSRWHTMQIEPKSITEEQAMKSIFVSAGMPCECICV